MKDDVKSSIRNILNRFQTSDSSRMNSASGYLEKTVEIFKAQETKDAIDLPIPQCVQFEITNFCTTGCKMCHRWTWTKQKDYTPQREMTPDHQIEVFKELSKLGVKTFLWTGGEPVANPNFCRLIEEAHSLGVSVGVLSNGVGITKDIADALVNYGAWIRISQDDVRTAHEKKNVRRVLEAPSYGTDHGDIFEELEKSIYNLKTSMMTNPRSKFKMGLAFTIQKNNIRSIPSMVEYATKHKIQASFKLAHGDGGKYLCTNDDLEWLEQEVLSNDEMLSNEFCNLKYLKNYFLKKLDKVDILEGLPTRSYYTENKITCFTTNLFSLIDAFGRVYVCCHLYDDNGTFKSEQRDMYCIGDVNKESFEEIWRGNAYQQMRKNLSPIDVCNTHCSNCTRHWVPNTIVTNLYDEVFVPLKNKLGMDEALSIYNEAIDEIKTNNPVWH